MRASAKSAAFIWAKCGRVQGERVALKLEGPLKPGDGVVFDAGHPDQDEEGGRVYTLETRGRGNAAGLRPRRREFQPHPRGRQVVEDERPGTGPAVAAEFRRRQAAVPAADQHLEVHGGAGQPMTLIARDEIGHVAQVEFGDAAGGGGETAVEHGKIARTTWAAGRHAV